MIMISFRSKKDKDYLLEKARKMEEYAAMVVECIEESKSDEEYDERAYRHYEDDYRHENPDRYSYNRRMMR